jgi:hypothetical protein
VRSLGIWGKVQGYGERYRDMGKGTGIWEEYLRIKVKFFRLTYFTFGFILPISILIF